MEQEKCLYTEDHEWVFVEDNSITIGVSNYAVEELGEVVFVELPETGTELAEKEEFGTIESVKTVSSLYAPTTATVTEKNTALEEKPDLINENPFSKGWLLKASINGAASLDKLMSHSDYKAYLETL